MTPDSELDSFGLSYKLRGLRPVWPQEVLGSWRLSEGRKRSLGETKPFVWDFLGPMGSPRCNLNPEAVASPLGNAAAPSFSFLCFLKARAVAGWVWDMDCSAQFGIAVS